jgi:hypothetical protein
MFSSVRIKAEMGIAEFKKWECLHQEVREPIIGNPDLLKKQTQRWESVGGLINARIDEFECFKNKFVQK